MIKLRRLPKRVWLVQFWTNKNPRGSYLCWCTPFGTEDGAVRYVAIQRKRMAHDGWDARIVGPFAMEASR